MSSGNGVPAARRRGASLRPRRASRVIAVSGADSFLGRNVVGLLEEDPTVDRVVLIDVQRPPTAGAKSRFYDVDLTLPSIESRLTEILHAEQVDTFVHLAFLSNPTPATAWAHELESVGTMHLLNACREHGLKKLVMRSTTLVYGPHKTNPNFLTEDHPARGLRGCGFARDKVDAEAQVVEFARTMPGCTVTVLRLAPVLGPTVHNYVSRWLSRRLVPTAMGFDPLVQLLHEADAVAALKTAIDRDAPGVLNIVGDGVLPISTLIKLAGRMALPVPSGVLRRVTAMLWLAQVGEVPPAFVDGLRYLCVADGERARREMQFRPAYSSRDAVLDFEGALRLREAKLLQEASS